MKHKIILKDAFKTFTLHQDKVRAPEETVKAFREKLSTLSLDILKGTRRIDNGRLDIPVYFSVCGKDATAVTGTGKQMGKGATPAQAEASAVMELAERFSFFSFVNTPGNFFTKTYKEAGPSAMPFHMIARSVHDDSADLEIEKKIFETLPLKWTMGYNLTQEKEALIPFNWFFMINEFNGPSAGNCVEEAISQGICEIVERHVSSLVSHGKRDAPGIIPESVKDPMAVSMLKKYAQAGVSLRLSDFSLDTGIPTVGVMAWDPQTFPLKSEIVWTAGTTPDPEKALSRALTETAQLAGDFNTGSNYVASGLPKPRDLSEGDFIVNPGKMVPIASLPNLSNENIRIEVENLVAALKRKEMEVFLINTEHPGLQIPAFYTIVPGAHFRERSLGTSVGMFSAKLITETYPPAHAMRKLLEMDQMLPGKYYVRFYLGTLCLAMEDPETALGHFEAALDLNPKEQDRVSIYSYMGVCLKEMERYEEAMAVLENGRALDNERTDIHNLMGFIHFKRKRHEEAIACFKKVIQLDPSSAIDYANIGSNYRELGNREKAIEYYLMALEIDPEITFARENLIKLQGDIDFK